MKIDFHDLATLTDLLKEVFNITFDGLNCIEHSSVKIQYNPKTGFWLHNFNPSNGLPENINAAGVLYSQKIKGHTFTQPQYQYSTTKKTTPQPQKPKAQPSDLKHIPIHQNTPVSEYFYKKGGISTKTLEKYNVRQIKAFRETIKKGVHFVYIQKNGIHRTKSPKSKHTEKKVYTLGKDNTNEYCFGLDQLPKRCDTILIVGGEDDALCINQHCNSSGVFAVSLNSETTQPSTALLTTLKGKCERLLLCYDNDNSGKANAKKQGGALCIDYIDSNFLYSDIKAKDICDLWQIIKLKAKNNPSLFLAKLIKTAIDSNVSISEDKDKFSVRVGNAWRCTFNQYLTENRSFQFLIHSLKSYSRIMLQSPAGTGKSFLQGELSKVVREIGLLGSIVPVPTTAIAEQLTNTIQKQFEGLNFSCVGLWGTMSKTDIEIAKDSTVIVCTYDKLKKILEHLNLDNYLLVVDEFHQLVNDFGYRSKVCKSVFDIAIKAKQSILMSATPNFLLASEIVPIFNFKLVQFIPQITNKINVQTIVHTDSKTGILPLISDFAPAQSEGVHCVKFDNNSALEAYVKQQSKNDYSVNITESNIEHLTSADPKKRELNETYKEIMQNGGEGLKLDALVYTSLLEAGVSFKFPVKCVSLLDVSSYSKFIQLSTRPRLQVETGVNEIVQVNLFLSSKRCEFTEYKNTVSEQFSVLYGNSCVLAAKVNSGVKGDFYNTTSIDVKTYIYENENGLYESDLLAILYELHERENATATPENIKLRVQRTDPRFNFLPLTDLDSENESIKEILKESKGEVKDCNDSFLELLKTDPINTLKAVYTKTKDSNLRENIKIVLGVSAIPRPESIDFILSNSQSFATRFHFQATKDILKLISTGETLTDSIDFYLENGHSDTILKTDLHSIAERKKAFKDGNLNNANALQLSIYFEVQKKFDNYFDNAKRGKVNQKLTVKKITEMINSVVSELSKSEILTERKAIQYLKRVYKIKRIRDKKTTHYILQGRVK